VTKAAKMGKFKRSRDFIMLHVLNGLISKGFVKEI
jgi:hypothetical protein